jgi:hypothetical protein
MPETMRFGISGVALVRAADAMLRSLGGADVTLLFPQQVLPDDTSMELGLVDPGVEQVKFCPVVVRNLPTGNEGPRRKLEFLLPASVVASEAVDRNMASGADLLNGALGLVHQGQTFHIAEITTECFAGTAYLYRVLAVE